MTAIDRTAYPHSWERLTRQELDHRYGLSEPDLVFVNSKARGASGRLTLAVLLKARQDLGFFPAPGDLHGETIAHLASQLGLADPLACVVEDTGEKTLYRYRTAVRTFLGIVAYDERSEDLLTASTMSDPADLINLAIEVLGKASIDLPAFSTLDRLANHLRTKVHTTIYARIAERLSEAFAAWMKEQLMAATAAVDAGFPDNTELSIDAGGVPHLKQQKASNRPEGLMIFEAEIHARMRERHLLDILKDSTSWTAFTRHFGPPSGADPKVARALQRYILTVFGYGCNLGPVQTARHAVGIASADTLRRLNAKHIDTAKLEAAMTDLINAYDRFELPKLWGAGQAAIADGTHIPLRENNLLGSQHIRYGGIAYHHIADNYVALFTTFIPCGVWEAIHILDGLLKNRSTVQPDTLHADTQGQSEPVFGLARLLGIKLMPRMRNWADVTFYRPDKSVSYHHIDALFAREIDWRLIETHWQDMMQVILSIQAGLVLPSMLLRKLSSHNRKTGSTRHSASLAVWKGPCFYCAISPIRRSGAPFAPKQPRSNPSTTFSTGLPSAVPSSKAVIPSSRKSRSNMQASSPTPSCCPMSPT